MTTTDGINQDLQDILDAELDVPVFQGWVNYWGHPGREYLVMGEKRVLLTLESEIAIHAWAWVKPRA